MTSSAEFSGSFAASGAASSNRRSVDDPFNILLDLGTATRSLEVGLFFAALTFGLVISKALTYFRKSTDGWLIKSTVVSMLVLNVVQMVATIDGVVHTMAVNFNNPQGYVESIDSHWGIVLQFTFAIYTGVIAHVFFTFRLRSVRKPGMNWLTGFLLFFTAFEAAMCGLSTSFFEPQDPEFDYWGYDTWPQLFTAGISVGINLTLAGIAYAWLQQPYVHAKYGKTTFWEELEYWTVKGLLVPSLLSLFIALTFGFIPNTLVWLTGVFMLGNLYTLSVILTLSTPTHDQILGHKEQAAESLVHGGTAV